MTTKLGPRPPGAGLPHAPPPAPPMEAADSLVQLRDLCCQLGDGLCRSDPPRRSLPPSARQADAPTPMAGIQQPLAGYRSTPATPTWRNCREGRGAQASTPEEPQQHSNRVAHTPSPSLGVPCSHHPQHVPNPTAQDPHHPPLTTPIVASRKHDIRCRVPAAISEFALN